MHPWKSPLSEASRRDLLKALAMSLPACGLWQSGLHAQAAKRGRIDVHQHMKSPADPSAGLTRNWTPEKAIADMERNGVATAIVMPVNSIREYLWAGGEKARGLVRENNEYGAKLVSNYPGRFGLYAALPLVDVEGSLKEIAYAYDTLKTDGIGLWPDTGADGKWLGHKNFAPIFDELNRRKSAVFFHPTVANCCHNLAGLGDGVVELSLIHI